MEKIITFLKEVRIELSKVSWPTGSQTFTYTLVVIGMSLFIAAILGSFDFIFKTLLDIFILN